MKIEQHFNKVELTGQIVVMSAAKDKETLGEKYNYNLQVRCGEGASMTETIPVTYRLSNPSPVVFPGAYVHIIGRLINGQDIFRDGEVGVHVDALTIDPLCS